MPPATLKRREYQEIISGGKAYATTLVTLCVDVYGTECFAWAPQTLEMEVNDDFAVKLPRPTFDRLLTGINLITSDDFYRSLPDFINYCNILSGDSYDPRSWDPADATECAWGITEALLLAPPDDHEENPFSDEIVGYIGAALDAEGIIQPPDVLKIAVRDQDPAGVIQGEFSDDPEMFDAIYDLESTKTGEINSIVRANLQQMARQLEALPLRNGSAQGVVQQMLQSLGQQKTAEAVTAIEGRQLRAITLD